jgi:mercuric ion transport protein
MSTPLTQDNERSDHAGGTGNHRATLLAAGGILAALGAASCCLIPFALFFVGVSGAWIGNLTALEPYQPIFAGVALGLIGYGSYLVYRKPKATCADGSYCARPSSSRLAKAGLWTGGTLVIAAIAFPHVIRVFAF